MKPTHSKRHVFLNNETKAAVAAIQQQRPLPTLSSIVQELIHEHIKPMKGSDRARQFLKQAGGDFALAHELLLQYLHGKYREFNSKRKGPGLTEYNRIRRTMHYIQQGRASA